MTVAHIFIDEYGTPNLDITKPGVTPYFVYSGIVIEENELAKARKVHKQTIDTHFGGTHIKSSNIPNDDKGHAKRMKVLSELSNFNHYVVALVVDKSKIDSDGLNQKRSFIKFFNNLLSKQFVDKYTEYHIHFDKLGRKDFQDNLVKYMNSNGHGKTLFANNSYKLEDDITEEPLIQFADFYSSCIGKNYCGVTNNNRAESIHNKIKSYTFIEWFPFEFVNYFGATSFKHNDFNQKISLIALQTATNYLGNNNDEIGMEIVKLLLQEAKINPHRHISSKEIKQKITSRGIKIGDPINEIAKLRDKGVFIVSPIGKKGYKFPCNEKEIAEFYDRLSANVVPQLKRAYILHKILVEQSFSEYNILDSDEFKTLSRLVDVTVNNQK